jgi:hypothetical protein
LPTHLSIGYEELFESLLPTTEIPELTALTEKQYEKQDLFKIGNGTACFLCGWAGERESDK